MIGLPDAVERMWWRMLAMLGVGRITATGDTGTVQRLQVHMRGDAEVRDTTPRVAEYGFTSVPKPGCDAVVIFVGGDRSEGIIIATGDQRYRLQGMEAGEVALYDDLGQVVRLTRTGIVVSSPMTVRVQAADIQLHASHSYSWDVNGFGERWTWTGGATWEHHTWQQGATVTSVTSSINPPEGP